MHLCACANSNVRLIIKLRHNNYYCSDVSKPAYVLSASSGRERGKRKMERAGKMDGSENRLLQGISPRLFWTTRKSCQVRIT